MAKIRVNLADLHDAIVNYSLINYREERSNFEVDLEIIEGNDPGNGKVIDVLTITLDKVEVDYSSAEANVRKIIEVFPANQPEMDNRITTQETKIVKRKKKLTKDEIPF